MEIDEHGKQDGALKKRCDSPLIIWISSGGVGLTWLGLIDFFC